MHDGWNAIYDEVSIIVSDEPLEVKVCHYDEYRHATAIDAWFSNDPNEEGVVLGWLKDDGDIEWLRPEYSTNPEVLSAIKEANLI